MTPTPAALVQKIGGWFAKAPEPAVAAQQAALRSDRFRIEREAEWIRLEAIVKQMEAGRMRRV